VSHFCTFARVDKVFIERLFYRTGKKYSQPSVRIAAQKCIGPDGYAAAPQGRRIFRPNNPILSVSSTGICLAPTALYVGISLSVCLFTWLITMTTNKILVILSFVAITCVFSLSTAEAQNTYHVRAGASGNGADWTNAFSALPATLVRGATYYVADGTYPGYTFDDAHSAGALIVIKKATGSDHGTSVGWQDAFGDGKATFNGGWTFARGYYTVDGQVGGGPQSWDTGFGFQLNGSVDMPQFVDNNSDYITLRHVDINVGQTGPNNVRGMILYAADYFSLQYVYLHDSGCDLISMNVMNNFLIEYSKLARNHQAEPGCHGDLIEYQIGNATNFTIRYNFIEDVVGSYAFGSHDPLINGYYIYGNIFHWTFEPFFGNGLVGCLSCCGSISNLRFYNNTLSGAFALDVGNIGFGILRGSSNQAYNNIWHRSTGTGFAHGWGGTTHSNNTFFNGSGGAEQNLSGNPFVNLATRNFSLLASTSAATAFPSPFNSDMVGRTRGTDGIWDRGALEFGGVVPTPPIAPTNLRIIP
jgi:hypothetical protein